MKSCSNIEINSGKNVVSGIGWTFAERILAQGVSFVVSILLARLLLPDDYGVISIVLVFINVANVFVTNGLGQALVHRKIVNQDEYSTVFWMSFLFSILLYAAMFFMAPYVATFYEIPILIPTLRILSLKIILSSLNTVQHAYVSKKMIFKKFFFATLGGTIFSAVLGIVLAYKGFGVWALVAQYLSNSLIDTIILQLTIDWRPKLIFCFKEAKELFDYGWKLTVSALIIAIYNELRSIIIGKVYSTGDLAYYNKGNHFPSVLINNLNSAIEKVFFPMMVELNSNLLELKRFSKKTLELSSYIVFPVLVWMIVCAEPIVSILLTDKWLPCVPYLQIMCLFWITQPMQTSNWQIIKAMGRSDLCVKLEIIKKIIGLALVVSTMFISVEALAWSSVIFSFVSAFVNMLPTKKLINYSIFEQMKDIIPVSVCALSAGICAYIASNTFSNDMIKLLVATFIGAIVYLLMSITLCREDLYAIKRLIKFRIPHSHEHCNK